MHVCIYFHKCIAVRVSNFVVNFYSKNIYFVIFLNHKYIKSKHISFDILFCCLLATGVAPCGTSTSSIGFGVHALFPAVRTHMLWWTRSLHSAVSAEDTKTTFTSLTLETHKTSAYFLFPGDSISMQTFNWATKLYTAYCTFYKNSIFPET